MPLDLVAGWNISNPDPIDTRHIVTQSSDRYGFSFARIHTGLATFESESQEYYILANSASYTNAAGWSRIYTSTPGGQGLSVSGSITASIAISSSNTIYTNNLEVATDISVSGDISASNTIYTNNLEVATDISVSGDISASGFLYDAGVATPSLYVAGDISSSANISASGFLNIRADNANGDYDNVVVYDTTTGRLYYTGSYDFENQTLQEVTDEGSTTSNQISSTAFTMLSGSGIVAARRVNIESSVEFRNTSDKLYISADGITGPSSVVSLSFPVGAANQFTLLDDTMLNLSIGAGATNVNIGAATSTTTAAGDLNVSDNLEVTGTGLIEDNLTVNASITASNNISASQTIYGNNLEIAQDITASNNISASGYISASNIFVSENLTLTSISASGDISASGLSYSANSSPALLFVDGDITSSANISASGDIYASNFYVDTLTATNLSSSTLTSSFVSASTLEVRSITASDSSGILGGITASNVFANKVIATNLGSSIKVISRDGDDLIELAENSSAGGGTKRGKLTIQDHNRSSGITTAIFLCPNGDNFISSSDDSGFAIGSITPKGKFSVHDGENPTITVQDERTSLSGVANDPYELGRYRFKSNENDLGNSTLAAFELVSWDQFTNNNTKSSQLRYVDHTRGSSSDYKTLLLSANHGLVIQKDQDTPTSDNARIQTEERPSLLTLKGFDGGNTPANTAATSSLFGGGEDSYLSWRAYSTSGYENYIDITNKGIEYKNTYDYSLASNQGLGVVASALYRIPVYITGSVAMANQNINDPTRSFKKPLFKVESKCGYDFDVDLSSDPLAYIGTLVDYRWRNAGLSFATYGPANEANPLNNGTTGETGLLYFQTFTQEFDQGGNAGYGIFCGGFRMRANGGGLSYDATSDRRLKTNIKDTKYGINDLLKIKVRDFDWWNDKSLPKPTGSNDTGFIAQELYEVYPKAALQGGQNPLTQPATVSPTELIPLLVKSIQDQQETIDNLQKEINFLKTKIK